MESGVCGATFEVAWVALALLSLRQQKHTAQLSALSPLYLKSLSTMDVQKACSLKTGKSYEPMPFCQMQTLSALSYNFALTQVWIKISLSVSHISRLIVL